MKSGRLRLGGSLFLCASAVAYVACQREAPSTSSSTAPAPGPAVARASTVDAGLASSPERIRAIVDTVKAQMDDDARLPVAKLFELPDDRLAGELSRRLSVKGDAQPLSRVELAILCPMSLSGEVDNGGFDQFFFNSSGTYALDTGNALRDVGLAAIGDIYDKALAAFPGTPERDTRARRAQMQRVPKATHEAWSRLDDEYYKTEPDVGAVVAKFAREHHGEIAP
jgi:hypothetical protein